MIIPITKVKKILDALLTAIRTDYNAAFTAGVETALLVEFNPAIVYTTEGIGNNLI